MLYTNKVLVTGGRNAATSGNLNTAELYHPGSGTFAATGNMTTFRRLHRLTNLPNGKILVTGGRGGAAAGNNAVLNTAELYDPATGTFTATGSMNNFRTTHFAILLYTGKVLIAGGQGGASGSSTDILNTAELYDPATGTFTATGNMITARNAPFLVPLANGKVLVQGGTDAAGTPIQSIEIYDPATGNFTAAGNAPVAQGNNRVMRLDSGRILIVGGRTTADASSVTNSANLYNHVNGTFSSTGSLITARADFSLTSLPNGRMLAAGGVDAAGTALNSAELYTPVIADAVDTMITSGPDAVTTSTSATFTFTSTDPNSTFTCSLDGSSFTACTSPQNYSSLAIGSHNFQVHATDSHGITDPTPANYDWTITAVVLHTLTVTKSGTGSGSVTSSPAGINCGADCNEAYNEGSVVSLTATPDSGSAFVSWSGACSGTGACSVTMTTDKNVTATFNLQPQNLADLTGRWGALTQACKMSKGIQKCKISGTFTVSNIGTVSAPSVSLKFYLSDDAVFNPGVDTLLKSTATGALKPGMSKAKKLSANLMPGVNGTGKFVIAVIDEENTVQESNKGNNKIPAPIP